MLTGEFRASYAHVFVPQAPKGGGDPKYGITLLIPKTDVNTYNAIAAEINKALQEGVAKVFSGQMPARPKLPLYDGDGCRQGGEPFGEECRGCWVLTASSKSRPSVVDRDVQPILDPNAFYSGCYARATINFFAYNQNGNKGVGCGLNNVQKVKDGEALSGRTTAEEDFGGTNTYAPGYGQPVYQPNIPAAPSYQPAYQMPQQTAAPVAGQMTNPGYQTGVDPITGRPVVPGGVMGI